MRKTLLCPHCSTGLKKSDADRVWQSDFDAAAGKIVKTAGKELALELEEKGYDWIKSQVD